MINIVDGKLCLNTISPAGHSMTVLISDDQGLVATLKPEYADGMIWITVPAAREAVGPIPLPEYLGHQTGITLLPPLVALASKRGDIKKLPPCHGPHEQIPR